jgi:signal transduction histidine kinase
LGLSITLRIVREHGGSLAFESELAKGTVFTVRLPGVAAEVETPDAD